MKITKADLEKEFAPYRNEFDFVTDKSGNKDHNPLFHWFYIDILDQHGFLDTEERNKQANLLQTLIHPRYPGILRSAPWGHKNSNEHSHDNVRAMLCASKRLGMTFAKDFLEHGRTHRWNWNADDPNVWEFAGEYERFYGMICQAQIAAGEHPMKLNQLIMNIELWISAYSSKKNVETIWLPYVMCKTIRNYNLFADISIDHWKAKSLKKYPDGLAGVFRQNNWGATENDPRIHPYVKHFEGMINV